jgi:hypothetical protein
MGKRPLPVTRCTNCGKAGYTISRANGPCARVVNGNRCKGLNQSAIGENDWIECSSCRGTGVIAANCPHCDGAGWIVVQGKMRR